MTFKKNLTAFIVISVLGTVWHFIYEWSGYNSLVGYIASTNESTWEHLKLLFFPALIYFAAEYFLKEKGCESFISASAFGIFLGMLTIVTLFYTYSGVLGKTIDFINIVIYYIGVAAMLAVRTLIIKNRVLTGKGITAFSIIITIIMAIAFFALTYNAPVNGIFSIPMPK